MTALKRPQPRPGVLDIAAYVPGKSSAPGVAKIYKLSSNESPLGASPKAIEAYQSVAHDLQDYPDGAATALREAIGKAYGLDPDRIICGAGSDDLINLLARAYLADGDEAIHTTHGFLMYPIATLGAGAKPVVAAEKNHTADVDAILKAVTPKTKMVFLANPNNPTGTYIPFDEVKRLHAGLPPHVLLVLDAAYAEYVRRNDYEVRHRAGRDHRECRDAAHLLENPRACGVAARLDLRARRISSTRSTAFADRSTSTRPRSPPALPRSPTPRMSRAARAHNEKWLPWLTDGDREARHQGDAERRKFHPDAFPGNAGQDRGRSRRAAHLARRHRAGRARLQAAELPCA